MASGYISGKKNTLGTVNIPIKTVSYTGEETSTANVVIDNENRTISVDVNVENVTKQCATKTEVKKAPAKKAEPAPAPITTKECPYCKSTIALAATRCPHCTSELSE